MVGTTFLSYSRKQYYFAESIALHLQHRGVSVWFDIQQLEPGVNWQADIEAGLAGCSSVTLVASRSALASSYVAREWRHALDHGKPIFVVLCERVRLPIELRQRAIIADCRGDFEQGVQALVVQFQNPDRSCNPATWLPRLPGGVRRMTRALWLHDLRHFTRVALNFMLPVLMVSSGAWPRLLIDLALGKIIDVPTVFGAFVVGLAILTLVRYVSRPKQTFTALTFLRHDFNYEALVAEARTVGAWTQMLGLWFSLAASYVIFSTDLVGLTASLRRLVHTEFSVEGLLALLAAILLVPVFNRLIPWIMPHHPDPDIVRWATPGNVSQAWRLEVNRGLAVQGTLPSEQAIRGMAAATDRYVPVSTASALPRTYQIIHASGDEKTASQVKIVLDGLRYAAVSSDAAYTILILSYRTPLPMIRDCLKTAQHVIGLLATDINLPGDLPELTRLQLIDYRSGGSQQLFSAFQFLGDDTEASRAALSQNLMPVNLAQNRKNRDLSSVFSSLLILACINLLYSVYFVARLAFFGLPLLPVPDALKPEAIGIVSLLVVNLVFIWFGMGALRGLARIPTGLLILIAAISPVFIALIDLSAHLPPQATLAVPSGKPVTIHLGIGQALAFIALYGLFYLLLARTLGGQPHLLNRPGTHAIGLESVKPDWRLVGSGLLLVIFLLFASLTSSGQ